MAETRHPFYFRSGLSRGSAGYDVIARFDFLTDADGYASEVISYNAQKGFSGFSVPWTVTRLAQDPIVSDRLFGVGPVGLVFIRNGAILNEQFLDESDGGPRFRGDIRDLCFIDGVLYAVGMSRQVYRRSAAGLWERRSGEAAQVLGGFEIAGFNAIAGVSEALIYAVGFGGEIWRCAAGNWSSLQSPTNLALTRVVTCGPEKAYACGQAGTILWISDDRVGFVDQNLTDKDLWGMVTFDGSIYVATDDAVIRIDDGISPKAAEVLSDCSCGHLHAAEGMIYSFGDRHIMRSPDGVIWEDVTPDEGRL